MLLAFSIATLAAVALFAIHRWLGIRAPHRSETLGTSPVGSLKEQRANVSISEGARTELPDLASLLRQEKQLRHIIASIRATRKRRKIQAKRNAPIKHFVATRGGGTWVAERLPNDDYADIRETVPTVDEFLSKPVGRRLSKGFNLIRHGDLDGE